MRWMLTIRISASGWNGECGLEFRWQVPGQQDWGSELHVGSRRGYCLSHLGARLLVASGTGGYCFLVRPNDLDNVMVSPRSEASHTKSSEDSSRTTPTASAASVGYPNAIETT